MIPEFTRARAQLLLKQPFFGTLCLRLTPIETEDIPTAGTDGKRLLYNPKFFLNMTDQQRVGLLAHEVMHVVFMHMARLNERDHYLWNVAGDYVINLVVRDAGLQLPPTDLLDDKYADMTTDEVYRKLQEDPDSQPQGGGEDGKESFGNCVQESSAINKNPGEFEADMRVAIKQAAEAAKAQGKLPGSLETLLGDIVEPKVNWKERLARFLRNNNKSDYSWQKPNRRFIGQGLYLPSMYAPSIEEIGVITDTSGSRTDEELNQDLSEISAMLIDANVDNVHFMQADTEVTAEETFTRESLPLKVTMQGRGGTAFGPAIAEMADKHPNISCLIYLTDLEASDFGTEPHFPVVWVSNYSTEAPYGEIIKTN